ncbi:putative nuclease HARBI1 [Drosophila tropicalis]|uniref:putative nuclease HARBI1 n=1 Tax=Drosophila tropicalis TaxID=46794 RepID=UPI0035AB9B5A
MQELDIFRRCLSDFKYVEDFKQFRHLANTKNSFKAERVKKRNLARFNPFTDLHEIKFRQKYRYTKENLRRIIEIIRDDMEIEPIKKNQVPTDLQILSAIRFWGGTEHPKLTAMAHGVSLQTMIKITKRVAAVLSSKASRYIRMPATLSEKERMMRSFEQIGNMPQVIGAVLHKTVQYQPVTGNLTIATPRQSDDLLHSQLVCDADYKIRDLDLRQPEEFSINTASEMFALSRIKERFEQNEFRGRILLGNERLICSPCLFTPVAYPKDESEDLYNHAHDLTFAPAKKCLNFWTRRFGVLNSTLYGSFNSAKQTITALALLHNMAMEWNDPSIDMGNNFSICTPTLFPSQDQTAQAVENRNRRSFIKTHFTCHNV